MRAPPARSSWRRIREIAPPPWRGCRPARSVRCRWPAHGTAAARRLGRRRLGSSDWGPSATSGCGPQLHIHWHAELYRSLVLVILLARRVPCSHFPAWRQRLTGLGRPRCSASLWAQTLWLSGRWSFEFGAKRCMGPIGGCFGPVAALAQQPARLRNRDSCVIAIACPCVR